MDRTMNEQIMRVHKVAIVLFAFCSKKYITATRYPLNFVGMFLSRIVLFSLLFLGGRVIAPTLLGDSLEAIIVGYFVFTISTSTFFNLEGMINNEAKNGTLEQLYFSPFGFTTIMFNAVIANILISTSLGILTLVFAVTITGEKLAIDLITASTIFFFTLLAAIGLSLLFGGVALLYKRLRSLFNIIDLVFIAIVSLAMTDKFWPKLLPVAQGASMLRESMRDGTRLLEFPLSDHALLIGTAVVYLVIGYNVFYISQHRARQKGLLDEY